MKDIYNYTRTSPVKGLPLLAKLLPAGGLFVEVGVWTGIGTRSYIEIVKSKKGKVTLIDHFKGNKGAKGIHKYNPDNTDNVKNALINRLSGYEDVYTIVEGESHLVGAELEDRSIDICFIDAAHHYEAVKRDIEVYLPKIKDGGILAGHDFAPSSVKMFKKFTPEQLKMDYYKPKKCHPGVTQAVMEKFGTPKMLPNCVWYVRL